MSFSASPGSILPFWVRIEAPLGSPLWVRIEVRLCDHVVVYGRETGAYYYTNPPIAQSVFAPLSFCMGIPWDESQIVGSLLGEKIVLTEFIAYMHLGEILVENGLSERSGIIASYALCGFANFASIGIQIGGIGSIAPNRMTELSALGLRAMIAGTLAACMTGTIAGVII